MYEEILTAHNRELISDAKLAALSFLTMGQRLHSRNFIQSPKHPSELSEFLELTDHQLGHFFEQGKFKLIKSRATTALAQWLLGKWPLALYFDIPPVAAVLRLQAQGQRCVTLFTDPALWESPKLTKDNALHFLVHDLEHAHQFFKLFHQEQVALNQRLWQLYSQGYFEDLQRSPLRGRVDYLLSDMNTHPEHASKYLEAIWYDFTKLKAIESPEPFVREKMSYLKDSCP